MAENKAGGRGDVNGGEDGTGQDAFPARTSSHIGVSESELNEWINSARGVAYNRLQSREDAYDAVQDAVLKFLSAKSKPTVYGKLKRFFITTVNRSIIDKARYNISRRTACSLTELSDMETALEDADGGGVRVVPVHSWEDDFLQFENMASIVDSLKPIEKEIAILRAEGNTEIDVGKALGLTREEVKHRVQTMRARVNKQWERP